MKIFVSILSIVFLFSCQYEKSNTISEKDKEAFSNAQIDISGLTNFASQKYMGAINSLSDSLLIPRSANPDGTFHVVKPRDWTSGFFSGSLWQLYELTGDDIWIQEGRKWSRPLESVQHWTGNHDLGFMFYCSYGNELRITDDTDKYVKEVLINASNALMKRFNANTGLIRSWDFGTKKGVVPTIIDNMMNLEMLMWAFKETGDSSYYKVSISHADKTMANHFRKDYSAYHVVDYDSLSGEVVRKRTFQGYADESTWARGQTWAMYGYTMMYRETGLERYLDHARATTDLFVKRLPDDIIPYWDFDDPDIPNAPKDASAGALAASAMLELADFEQNPKESNYFKTANKLLSTLSTKQYLIQNAKQKGVLAHSTGHLPAHSEIDVHLNYADYYYLEALNRLKKMNVE